jgi:hypothetical protein
VSFGSGGFRARGGYGAGVLVWDGVPGLADANNNKAIDISEIDLGLTLDLTAVGADPRINITDYISPFVMVNLLFLTDHSNYAQYTISGTARPYEASIAAPSLTEGVFDPTHVKAVALFIDDWFVDDVDVSLNRFVITTLPDQGCTFGLTGISLLDLAAFRRYLDRAIYNR